MRPSVKTLGYFRQENAGSLCEVPHLRDDTRKKEEPRRLPGGVHLTNLDYSVSDISQPPPAQQAPGQQEPPPQQSSWLDEIDVALVSAMNAAIIRKYFISSPVEVSELSATPRRTEPSDWKN
jgi:hypothetical protein